jgi:DNA-binding CsgD family transcriptional regulator
MFQAQPGFRLADSDRPLLGRGEPGTNSIPNGTIAFSHVSISGLRFTEHEIEELRTASGTRATGTRVRSRNTTTNQCVISRFSFFLLQHGNQSSKQRNPSGTVIALVPTPGPFMGKSQRLRLSDVRVLYQLLGECRELGADWELWCRHMLTAIIQLTAAKVATLGNSQIVDGGRLTPTGSVMAVGWQDAAEESLFQGYMRSSASRRDPFLCKFVALGLPSATRRRTELVDDRTWYGSEAYNEWCIPMGFDDVLISRNAQSKSQLSLTISVHRAIRAPGFGRRQRQLVQLLQQETARLIGTALAAPGEPSLLALSPRLRQTLVSLLEGDGEKQTAARLGLSRPTVHQYVGQLYRHFGVNDRAELLSLFLRRSGLLPRLRALLTETVSDGTGKQRWSTGL